MRIGEAATGIGEQMADTGLAIQRAKDKTEQMQARASAIDELTESGALEDFTSDQTELDRELGAIASKSQVDEELAQMKSELGSGEQQKELESVIVRLMGEGQFEVDEEVAKGLNDLDEQAGRALEAGDEEQFSELLERMAEAVRTNGSRAAGRGPRAVGGDRPAEDLTLDEARELFEGDGLIPDLPTS